MTFSIIAGILLVALLVIKSQLHEAFVKDKVTNTAVLIVSSLLIVSGLLSTVILFIKGSSWSVIDYSLAAFISGIAITGFVAETTDKELNKFSKKKGKKKSKN